MYRRAKGIAFFHMAVHEGIRTISISGILQSFQPQPQMRDIRRNNDIHGPKKHIILDIRCILFILY
jgi:hypothetical protein